MKIKLNLGGFTALAVLPITLVSALLVGCHKPPPAAAPVDRTNAPVLPTNQSASTMAATPETERQPEVFPIMQDQSMSPGDKAWHEVLKSMQPPPPPAEWQTNPPSPAEIAVYQSTNALLAAHAADQLKDFYTKYPDHSYAPMARQQEFELLSIAVQLGNTNRVADLKALEKARMDDPNATEDERFRLRIGQLQREVGQAREPAEALAAMEKGAQSLQKQFPNRPEVSSILLQVAEGRLQMGQTETGRSLLDDLLKGDAPEEVKTEATQLKEKLDLVGQPLQLQFTAVDGRQVDLQKMDGKVVLVDFWATWCAPCRAELPKVKEAYRQWHDKGFEIVGISFDQEKDALTNFVARESMPWPQYFESSGDNNKYGEQFHIGGIPAMWLVDKKGKLRELFAREDLSGKVAKLIAE